MSISISWGFVLLCASSRDRQDQFALSTHRHARPSAG